MKYIGTTKEEALQNASEDQQLPVEELVYDVVDENEAGVMIEVY